MKGDPLLQKVGKRAMTSAKKSAKQTPKKAKAKKKAKKSEALRSNENLIVTRLRKYGALAGDRPSGSQTS
jgi:hypothetical protein